MAHPAKKQKTDDSSSPVVFTIPRAKPDIRLYVFRKEFHVYSEVLKVASFFFYAMLEPSGGIQPSSDSPLFKSDWFTKIDNDGTWSISCDSKLRGVSMTAFKGRRHIEERAFQNLLCAIFNKQYVIDDEEVLTSMTINADYYLALPILSSSILDAIFNSTNFMRRIKGHVCEVLEAAYKLRHKMLFRECIIHALGPWNDPVYHRLKSQVLFHTIAKVEKQMKLRIYELQCDLLEAFSEECGAEFLKEATDLLPECKDTSGRVVLPQYFRNFLQMNRIMDKEMQEEIQSLVSPILENHLLCDRSAVAGKEGGDYDDRFLSIEIQDEDLPWDLNETDW